jgi:hypothetical protein
MFGAQWAVQCATASAEAWQKQCTGAAAELGQQPNEAMWTAKYDLCCGGFILFACSSYQQLKRFE